MITTHKIREMIEELDPKCEGGSDNFKVASILLDKAFNPKGNPHLVWLRCSCSPPFYRQVFKRLNRYKGFDAGWIIDGQICVITFWLYVLMGTGKIGRELNKPNNNK